MARYYEDARKLAYMLTEWAMTLQPAPAPLRRHLRRRPRHYGSRQPRRPARPAAKPSASTSSCRSSSSPNPYITPALNFEFHYFFMRKYWFAYLAKALVVFPGGFGTLDEMFELLTLAQTHKLAKKITVIVYGSAYWQSVLNLDVLVNKGAISPRDRDLFQFANTPEEAFAILKDGLTLNHLVTEPPPVDPDDENALRPEIAKTRR